VTCFASKQTFSSYQQATNGKQQASSRNNESQIWCHKNNFKALLEQIKLIIQIALHGAILRTGPTTATISLATLLIYDYCAPFLWENFAPPRLFLRIRLSHF